MNISIQKNKIQFSKLLNTFFVNGKDVKFDTLYMMINEKTGNKKLFSFTESTGSEWDVHTKWIYQSADGYILEVGNEDITQQMIDNYVEAKTRI